jgi:hypothetical protein
MHKIITDQSIPRGCILGDGKYGFVLSPSEGMILHAIDMSFLLNSLLCYILSISDTQCSRHGSWQNCSNHRSFGRNSEEGWQ